MFPTMNGLLLSHFIDCDTASYTRFSVCFFLLQKYVNEIKYCCLYIRFYFIFEINYHVRYGKASFSQFSVVVITLQNFSILTCIFIEMCLSDYNQLQQLIICRDNLMFPTMNGWLLSRFVDTDTAAYTQFSVCFFFTLEVRECNKILLPLYSLFFIFKMYFRLPYGKARST